jgi:hypothetical protein
MDVTGDYTAQNLSAAQRDVMKLIVRALSNKEIASMRLIPGVDQYGVTHPRLDASLLR